MRERLRRLAGYTDNTDTRTVGFSDTDGAHKVERRKDDIEAWDRATLTMDGYPHLPIYAAKLTPRDGSSDGVYTYIKYGHYPGSPSVDIPLRDYVPEGSLVEDFYLNTTFFGEIDGEKFESFATDTYMIERVIAYLNKKALGGNEVENPELFYDNFHVDHMEENKNVFIGSHGSRNEYGLDFHATIELSERNHSDKQLYPEFFVNRVSTAFPHLSLEPLSKNDYLIAIASTLPFQPKDWPVS